MDLQANSPIWLQLVAEFERRIVTGQWREGDKLPSVRELAVEVGVNPNTVQRALLELDARELTAPQRTAGRFVRADHAQLIRLRENLGLSAARGYYDQATGLGLDRDQSIDLLEQVWETPAERTDTK